jgi:hypothetical protein
LDLSFELFPVAVNDVLVPGMSSRLTAKSAAGVGSQPWR